MDASKFQGIVNVTTILGLSCLLLLPLYPDTEGSFQQGTVFLVQLAFSLFQWVLVRLPTLEDAPEDWRNSEVVRKRDLWFAVISICSYLWLSLGLGLVCAIKNECGYNIQNIGETKVQSYLFFIWALYGAFFGILGIAGGLWGLMIGIEWVWTRLHRHDNL